MNSLRGPKPGLPADFIPRVEALQALIRERQAGSRMLTLEEEHAIAELAENLRKLLDTADCS
jgi:hypothetical protein